MWLRCSISQCAPEIHGMWVSLLLHLSTLWSLEQNSP
jgi:hypothetical protein